jgi:fibronectin type 3 domain-containing protein
VTITSVSTSGPGFSLSGLSLPLDIAAGKAVSFSVSFTPSNSGQASGSVQLSNTASPIAIALNGNGTTAAQHSVTANWIASVSPVAGYNVYRSTQSGGPFMKVNSTIVQDTGYTDTSVTSGSTYFYAVTAVDANSQESNFSNEAKATVPTP